MKQTETFMSGVGFEPTTSVFERAKSVYASGSAAPVVVIKNINYSKLKGI
jgi:hypothetical protein